MGGEARAVARVAVGDDLGSGLCPPLLQELEQNGPKAVGRVETQHVPGAGEDLERAEKRGTFAGISEKPSDGLEPSTPSLPWRCSTD